MATSAVALAVTDVNESRRSRTRTVKVTIAAGDYVSGGLTLNLTTVTNPNNLPEAKFGSNPVNVTVKGNYGVYDVKVIPGSALTNWKLQLWTTGASSNAVFTEAPVSAINAGGVSTNFVLLDFIGPKNL